MTGRELASKLNYLGMERDVRKLALKDHPDMTQKIAIMSDVEVCDLVAEDYEMIYAESEEIGLVKHDDMEQCFKLIHKIKR